MQLPSIKRVATVTVSLVILQNLSGYVVHYVENDEVVVNVKLPEKDDYVLNIFAY